MNRLFRRDEQTWIFAKHPHLGATGSHGIAVRFFLPPKYFSVTLPMLEEALATEDDEDAREIMEETLAEIKALLSTESGNDNRCTEVG